MNVKAKFSNILIAANKSFMTMSLTINDIFTVTKKIDHLCCCFTKGADSILH